MVWSSRSVALVSTKAYLAIDLGASSGKVIVGTYDGHRISVQEVHRFPNGAVSEAGSLRWPIRRLFREIQTGIGKALQLYGNQLVSIGVDTWGIDYALLDGDDELIEHPYHYRDMRTTGIMDRVVDSLGAEYLYNQASVQFMEMNTLFQLIAAKEQTPQIYRKANSLLFIPDLINFWLTGSKLTDKTLASTSQIYDTRLHTWAYALLEKLDLSGELLQDLYEPGYQIGALRSSIIKDHDTSNIRVVLTGTHDTASAVAAVPANTADWGFLSSGTWSVLGVETSEPIINLEALRMRLGNETGVYGTVRPLKNVSGLWLLQEAKRIWSERGMRFDYENLNELAIRAEPFSSLINPDDTVFLKPGDVPSRIREYCYRTNQNQPSSEGQVVRTILEGLALRYRTVLDDIDYAVGRECKKIHIVGGGAKNELLNQFTANATNRPVVAGPFEATAIGNILVQLIAHGEVSSLQEARELSYSSFDRVEFEPQHTSAWSEAYEQFCTVVV